MRPAVIAMCMLLAGCCFKRPPADPLLSASCPPLTPLADASFGATTLKLIEVAGQYRECRCAALPDQCDR